jgi:hypothetical protein
MWGLTTSEEVSYTVPMRVHLSQDEINLACVEYVWDRLTVYGDCTSSLRIVLGDNETTFIVEACVECPDAEE